MLKFLPSRFSYRSTSNPYNNYFQYCIQLVRVSETSLYNPVGGYLCYFKFAHSSTLTKPKQRRIFISGLEIKIFSREPNCILKKPLTGVVYRNQYIFGLPADIWGSRWRIQGSPRFPAPPNFKPCM